MKTTDLKHFCTHALTALIDQHNHIGNKNEPWGVYTGALVKWLRQAQKFAVKEDELKTVPGDIIHDFIVGEPRLPFQFTAIEVDLIHARGSFDLGGKKTDVKIDGAMFMCAELQAIEQPIFDAIKEDIDMPDETNGFLIWPILKSRFRDWEQHTQAKWVASPSMAIVLPGDEMADWWASAPYRQKHMSAGNEGDPCIFVQHLIDHEMVQEKMIETFLDHGLGREKVTPEFIEHETAGLMQALGEAMLTEVGYVAALCVLLNTKNVVYRTHPAPAKLNLKRKKKGREPFYEYRTLKLYSDAVTYVGPTLGKHRFRVSPKLHLRRGHVRRLHAGGTTFVRAAIIGRKKRGMVVKDYQVEKHDDHK